MLTPHNLTIYNKYIDPTTRLEKYQRASVVGVNWQAAKAVFQGAAGMVRSDVATIFIPLARGATTYKLPIAWQALVTKTGYWTIQEGDIVVKGTVTDEITTEFTVTNLRAKYDNCLVVTSVDTNDQGSASIQHWKVGAK
jgi:hypothetical protein